MKALINQQTRDAIMINALSAFRRESWLMEAGDIHEATGAPTAEIIEGMFSPFCDRLVNSTKYDKTPDSEKALRFYYFSEFSKLAI